MRVGGDYGWLLKSSWRMAHISIYKGGVLVENTLVLHVSVACPEVLPNALGLQYR